MTSQLSLLNSETCFKIIKNRALFVDPGMLALVQALVYLSDRPMVGKSKASAASILETIMVVQPVSLI